MADGGAGAIGADQMRKRRFQFRITPHQRIVFGVRYLGRVFSVVKLVMLGDLPRQPHQFVRGIRLAQARFDGLAHKIRTYACSSNRSACARASGVISAPESIRAISS